MWAPLRMNARLPSTCSLRALLPEELGFAVEFRLARHRARQPSEAQRALEEDLLAAFA